MTVRLTKAQEREACVESVMPSPSQTTEDSWRSSRSIENDTIWVSKSNEILLDLWKPVVRYEFSYLVTTSASLAINNGNLELVDGKEKSTWSINIPESSNSSAAVLLDTGNFVVADDKGHHLWESFDCPGGTLLPEMALGFDSESGKRNVLTAWKSLNDPSRGLFLVELAQEIPAQGFIWINGSTPYWRNGPWELLALCLRSMPWTGYFLKNPMSMAWSCYWRLSAERNQLLLQGTKARFPSLCKGLDFVDEVLADSYSASEVTRCMDIGLLCVQNNAADRPTIADVVFMVRSETDRVQPKQPTFTFQNSLSDITMFGLQMKPLYHFSKDDNKREPAQLAELSK
nr:G-type lectin S-receptor-like serine/threonine-protein kinase At1g61390 [Malus domestica]